MPETARLGRVAEGTKARDLACKPMAQKGVLQGSELVIRPNVQARLAHGDAIGVPGGPLELPDLQQPAGGWVEGVKEACKGLADYVQHVPNLGNACSLLNPGCQINYSPR
jgi:hypothetical protein